MENEKLTDYVGRWINEDHKIELEVRNDHKILFYRLGDYKNVLTSFISYDWGNELSLGAEKKEDEFLLEYSLHHNNGKLKLIHYQTGEYKEQGTIFIPLTKNT